MTKRHEADSGSSDGDGDEGSHHDDKVAIRRARNREAARRVRERRLNTIRTLSDQVEALTAENQRLREYVASLPGSAPGSSQEASMGIKQEQQEPIPAAVKTVTRTTGVQTELAPASQAATAAGGGASGASPQQAPLLNSLQQMLQQLAQASCGGSDGAQQLLQQLQQAQQIQQQQQQLQQVQLLLSLMNGNQAPHQASQQQQQQSPSMSEALQLLGQLQAAVSGGLGQAPPLPAGQHGQEQPQRQQQLQQQLQQQQLQQQLQQQQLVQQLQQQIQAALAQQHHHQLTARPAVSRPKAGSEAGASQTSSGSASLHTSSPAEGPTRSSSGWLLHHGGSGGSGGSSRSSLQLQLSEGSAHSRHTALASPLGGSGGASRSSFGGMSSGLSSGQRSSTGGASAQGSGPPSCRGPPPATLASLLPPPATVFAISSPGAAPAGTGAGGSSMVGVPQHRHSAELMPPPAPVLQPPSAPQQAPRQMQHPRPPPAAAAEEPAPMSTSRNVTAPGDDQEPVFMSTDMNLLTSDFNLMMSEELLRHVPLPDEAAAQGNTAWL